MIQCDFMKLGHYCWTGCIINLCFSRVHVFILFLFGCFVYIGFCLCAFLVYLCVFVCVSVCMFVLNLYIVFVCIARDSCVFACAMVLFRYALCFVRCLLCVVLCLCSVRVLACVLWYCVKGMCCACVRASSQPNKQHCDPTNQDLFLHKPGQFGDFSWCPTVQNGYQRQTETKQRH